MKIAGEKSTWPGIKQVVRVGNFDRDVIQLHTEPMPQNGRTLLEPVMRGGSLIEGAVEPLDVLRDRAARELNQLPSRYRVFDSPDRYPVEFSEELLALQRSAMKRHRQEPERG